jgi:hypothetical protein
VRKRKKEWDEERDIPERRNEAKNKLKRERMTGERRLFGTAAELKRCKKDAPTGTKKKLERVIKEKERKDTDVRIWGETRKWIERLWMKWIGRRDREHRWK